MTLDLTETYRDDECIQYECGAYDELLVFEECLGNGPDATRFRVYLSGEPHAWCDAYTMSRYTASASFPEALLKLQVALAGAVKSVTPAEPRHLLHDRVGEDAGGLRAAKSIKVKR
jgi:hypothetical protein